MTNTRRVLTSETFAHGFAAGAPDARWFHVQMGAYTTDDGIATPLPGAGLRVVSRGTNAATGDPAFSVSLPHESASGGIPATNDHAKWLAYLNHRSAAGFPGFDAIDGRRLTGTARIGGRTFGSERHPFGAAVPFAESDVRLSAFAMTTIDLETFMVFDFLFTNRRVYAFYERLPFGRTAADPYAAFSYAIPVKHRTEDEMHEAAVTYDRAAGVVSWVLDGVEVFRVNQIGRRLTGREDLLIDLGGTEQTVAMRQLDFGMGLFTLLDGAVGGGPGLVRLSDNLPYYAPHLGEPRRLSFVDESSRRESRLFGQGAEMRIASYTISDEASASDASARLQAPLRHVPRGEGRAVWVAGDTYTFKAVAGDTDGRLTAWEATVPPGGGPPPHVHREQDEAYYLLDGEVEVLDGDRLFQARAGDFVFIPRGRVHRFRNVGQSPSRMLIWMTPAGFEEFLFRVGRPARAGEQAPPLDADEIGRSVAIAPEYGMEIAAPEARA